MKKFLVRSLCFFSAAMLVLLAIVGCTLYALSLTSFKLPPDKHILVEGYSLTECAINDNIFTSAANLSRSGKPYIFAYSEIKKILESNPQIDTVLLSFDYRLLTQHTNHWIKNIPSLSQHLMLLSKQEIFHFFAMPTIIAAALQTPFLNYHALLSLLTHRPVRQTVGGYLYHPVFNLQRAIAAGKEAECNEISLLQRDYLLKIAALCNARNVTLILIGCPIYKPEIYDYHPKKLADYRKAYVPNVPYLNYASFPLPDSAYADLMHLNYRGAKIFSEYLRDNLAKDLRAVRVR